MKKTLIILSLVCMIFLSCNVANTSITGKQETDSNTITTEKAASRVYQYGKVQYYTSQSIQYLEYNINRWAPVDVKSIQGGLSGPDGHIWVNSEYRSAVKNFKLRHIFWYPSAHELVREMLSTNRISVMGFSGNDFWYIEDMTPIIKSDGNWEYATYNSNIMAIESFINTYRPKSLDGIQGGASGPDIHVWVRNDQSNVTYNVRSMNWNSTSAATLTNLMNSGLIYFLGFNENTAYYIQRAY